MRFGVYFDLRNPPAWQLPWVEHYQRNLELIELAEEAGADSVWASEHHQWVDGYLPQPLTFLAAVAMRTRRVRLGTSILIAALRPALQVAEEAALVDVLSGGRVELGLGVGWSRDEYAAFGADYGRRRQTTRERIDEIRSLLDGDGTAPPPVQRPFPLWAGYRGPIGARTAGRLGVGLLSLERELATAYLAAAAASGHASTVKLAGNASLMVARDPQEARERALPHYAWQLDTYAAYGAKSEGKPAPEPVDLERLRRRRSGMLALQVLTVEQTIERVRELTHGLPVEDVYIFANVGGLPDDLARENIELWCGPVRDAFRGPD